MDFLKIFTILLLIVGFAAIFSSTGLASSVNITSPEKGASVTSGNIVGVVSVVLDDSDGVYYCATLLNGGLLQNVSVLGNGTLTLQDSLSLSSGVNAYKAVCSGTSEVSDESKFSYDRSIDAVLVGAILALIVIIVWLFRGRD